MTDVILESQMYQFNDHELGLLETADVDSTELGLEKAETFMAFLNKLVKEDILKKQPHWQSPSIYNGDRGCSPCRTSKWKINIVQITSECWLLASSQDMYSWCFCLDLS